MSTLSFAKSSVPIDPVREAVSDLVTASKWGDTTFVKMPMFSPGGSHVTVAVARTGAGFLVSDHGFSYRELEAIGAERSFGRAASMVAERHDLLKDRRRLFLQVEKDDLYRAICDVAAASWSLMDKVYIAKSEEDEEDDIEEQLGSKLISLFGENHVRLKEAIQGSSMTEWRVSALVVANGRRAVFQAVGSHSNSIYKANTAFHDLAGIPHPPSLISVVKSKEQLGSKLGLLSQVGRVIEECQPSDVFKRAAG